MNSLWVVIPAKDEAETIGDLVRGVSAVITWLWETISHPSVIVVDDGSKDGTGQEAQRAGAIVLYHEECQGIGPSIMDGWRKALDSGAQWILVIDAGGSHYSNDIFPLVYCIYDWDCYTKPLIAIGSRFVQSYLPYPRYEGSRWRAICSRLMALLCNLSQRGKWISDWTSGFRLYSAGAVRQLLEIKYQAKMHGWQMEVLGWARYLHFAIGEVPIFYTAGHSSLSWSGVLEAFNVWMAIVHQRGK